MGKVSPTSRPKPSRPPSARRPRPRRSGSSPYLRQIAARASVIKGAVFMRPLPPFLGELLDCQADGHFQGVRTVVVVTLREVLQLLDQEQRSRRAGLEVQLPLRQVGRQPADADLLVHDVGDAVERQKHLLLFGHAAEVWGKEV